MLIISNAHGRFPPANVHRQMQYNGLNGVLCSWFSGFARRYWTGNMNRTSVSGAIGQLVLILWRKDRFMLGAIIGDIVGSPYEFDHNNIKTTDFTLFCERSSFTDDTIMTLAVAAGLMDGDGDPAKTENAIMSAMLKLGRMYPDAGYGANFANWLSSEMPKPYNSFGNGSAMRVSAVSWLFETLTQVEEYARISSRITHNHPEGIKGAQATASAIYMARSGKSKADIKQYIEQKYDYDLSRSLDEIRPRYHHVESCQETVPEAMIAFLESNDFEDAIRKAVSLGGDSDTLTAITGSIAEGFYGIPEWLVQKAVSMLDQPLLAILNRWQSLMKKKKSDL